MENGKTGLLPALPTLLRIRQWSKNLFIFAALVFSQHLFDPAMVLIVFRGFLAFSLAASMVYIINDIRDREEDRQHPEKKNRPLASGRVGVPAASAAALGCLILSAVLLYPLPAPFQLTLLGYVLMQIFYTFAGKKIVILDALIIAIGFVLRVAAGGFIIFVHVSSWLILCTFFLALFLAFCKRRHELVTLEEATNHRQVLREYSLPFLDQMINTATAATILCYALYVTSPVTLAKFSRAPYLMLTVPFVVFGIYRYLYLIHQKNLGGNPTDVLTSDPPFTLNLLLWISASVFIVYTGT